MQDYGRGGSYGQPYDNRIYARKYDLDVGEPSRPDIGVPATTSNHEYAQRQSFTQGRSAQRNWQEQRHAGLTENYAKPAMTPVGSANGYVSTFKSSREDDLLKKLDMYEQKYQLGGPAKTPQAGQARKMFEAVQLPVGRPTHNEFQPTAVNRRQYPQSNNNSPQREREAAWSRPDIGSIQKSWKQPSDYEVGAPQRFDQQRRNDPIRILDADRPDDRQDFHKPTTDLRSSYEGARFSYNPQAQPINEEREYRRPRDKPISYDIGIEERPAAGYQPHPRNVFDDIPEPPKREIRADPYVEGRASFDRPTHFEASKGRSISQSINSMKVESRPIIDPRQPNDYRGQPNRGIYNYRQGTYQRNVSDARNHFGGQPRRYPDENLFTQQEPLKTVENDRQGRKAGNSSQSRMPLASKQLLENRQDNRTDNSQWDEPEKTRPNQKPENEREDRLRDIRRKVSVGAAGEEPSFQLQRSEKKQSLRDRSEQLRQKMNEPSPLKDKLNNNNRTDRTSKDNKQNIEHELQRNRSVREDEPCEKKRRPAQSEQTDNKEQTPSKQLTLPERKLEFEEETYRKIETINDLNNKINERIRHILSSFNQDTC